MYDQVTLGLNVDPFILSALKEDITSEDVSTNSVMPHPQQGEVDLICKEDGIICGLQVFERTFTLLDSNTTVEFFVKDGDHVKAGDLMAKVHGDIRVLLCGENFSDGVLLKDNHIGAAGDVKEAVKMAKAYAPRQKD